MSVLKEFEPTNVLSYFEELCKIPHGSGNTKAISDYCVQFAKDHNLRYIQDEYNDVIIYKDGTEGFENSAPVIIQGHLDMVCEKTLDSTHDFMKDPLDLKVENGYLYAQNTSLGGDDGIAIAYALSVLASDTIAHPPIEAVFTVDEETSMLGAEKLDMTLLKGRRLLNIDSEEEGVLTCGCAGGLRQHVTFDFQKVEKEGTEIELWIKGLLGGHSGSDIHKQRGNAVKLSSRMYIHLSKTFAMDLISIDGGEKDNVITYSAKMRVLVDSAQAEEFIKAVRKEEAIWKKEFSNDETGLNIEITNAGQKNIAVIAPADSSRIMKFIYAVPQGLICSDRNLPGQSETSLNLGVTVTREDSVFMQFLLRSSIETKKQSLCERVGALVELAGGRYIIDSEYPAWGYDPNSKLRPLMRDVYVKMFKEEPRMEAVHTGLECGIFGGHCEGLDSVSFGPNILDIHSINEKLDLASVERIWRFLLEVLKACK